MTKVIRIHEINKAADKLFSKKLLAVLSRIDRLEKDVSALRNQISNNYTVIPKALEEEEAKILEVKE